MGGFSSPCFLIRNVFGVTLGHCCKRWYKYEKGVLPLTPDPSSSPLHMQPWSLVLLYGDGCLRIIFINSRISAHCPAPACSGNNWPRVPVAPTQPLPTPLSVPCYECPWNVDPVSSGWSLGCFCLAALPPGMSLWCERALAPGAMGGGGRAS